ncbi:MAG: DUF3011 domain-containing protein [Alphaproteobacteria bacterium]|nr:DUF3011 domain-containing protein [Alphaproteobacteria bacterium]
MKFKTALNSTIASAALCLGLAGTTAPAHADSDLRCNSAPGAYNYCRADTSGGVTLNYQHSRYGCYQNDTWGYDRNGIWVSNGCSATFRIGARDKDDGKTAAAIGLGILALGVLGAIASQDNNDHNDRSDYPPPPPPPGYDPNYPPPGGYDPNYPPPPPQDQYDPYDPYGTYGNAQIVYCDSKKNKLKVCPVRVRDYVQLVRQRSKSACRFNKTWGYDRRSIWVNKGCRAEFAIY